MKLVNKKALIVGVGIAIVFIGYFFLVYNRHLPIKGAVNGGNHSISGTVTSKFTDCVGGEEMNPQGNITPIRSVSCDGGSTITIDFKHSFVTATGLVAPGNAYSKDVSKVKVGDSVIVHYTTDSQGYKSLNCNSCGVSRQ
jgi:hypothetical protein